MGAPRHHFFEQRHIRPGNARRRALVETNNENVLRTRRGTNGKHRQQSKHSREYDVKDFHTECENRRPCRLFHGFFFASSRRFSRRAATTFFMKLFHL
jgi:hypothetical protein